MHEMNARNDNEMNARKKKFLENNVSICCENKNVFKKFNKRAGICFKTYYTIFWYIKHKQTNKK